MASYSISVGRSTALASRRSWVRIPLKTPAKFSGAHLRQLLRLSSKCEDHSLKFISQSLHKHFDIHLLAGMSGIHLNQQDGIAQLLEHREENPRVVPARFLSD